MSLSYSVGELAAIIDVLEDTRRVVDKVNPSMRTRDKRIDAIHHCIKVLESCMQVLQVTTFEASNGLRDAIDTVRDTASGLQELFEKNQSRLFVTKFMLNSPSGEATKMIQQLQAVVGILETRLSMESSLATVKSLHGVQSHMRAITRVSSIPLTGLLDITSENPMSSEPEDASTAPSLHIIMVHDIGGHAHETWKGPSVDWIADFLAKDLISNNFQRVQISPYAYDIKSLLSGDFTRRITLEAKKLVDSVSQGPHSQKVIFFCHGVGGLIVKTAIHHCQQARPFDQDCGELLNRLSAFIFFGLPDWTAFGALDRHMVKLEHTGILRSMISAASWIVNHPLSLSAYAITVDRSFEAGQLVFEYKIAYFHETQETITSHGPVLVSERYNQKGQLVPGNYFSMCHLSSRETKIYTNIKSLLVDSQEQPSDYLVHDPHTNEGSPSKIRNIEPPNKVHLHQKHARKRIVTPIALDTVHIEQFLSTLRSSKRTFEASIRPSSSYKANHPFPNFDCSWVPKTLYEQWINAGRGASSATSNEQAEKFNDNLLNIVGKPKTGKSVLAKYLLQQSPSEDSRIIKIAYVEEDTRSTPFDPSVIIKSLIWQLLQAQPSQYSLICNQFTQAPVHFDELASVLILIASNGLFRNLEILVDFVAISDNDLIAVLERLSTCSRVKVLVVSDKTVFDNALVIDMEDLCEEKQPILLNFTHENILKYGSLSALNDIKKLAQQITHSAGGSFEYIQLCTKFLSLLSTHDRVINYTHSLTKRGELADLYESFDLLRSHDEQSKIYDITMKMLLCCNSNLSIVDLSLLITCNDEGLPAKTCSEILTAQDLLLPAKIRSLTPIFSFRRHDIIGLPTALSTYNIEDGSRGPITRRWPSEDGIMLQQLKNHIAHCCMLMLAYYSSHLRPEELEVIFTTLVAKHVNQSFTAHEQIHSKYPLLEYSAKYWITHLSDTEDAFGTSTAKHLENFFRSKNSKDLCKMTVLPTYGTEFYGSLEQNIERICGKFHVNHPDWLSSTHVGPQLLEAMSVMDVELVREILGGRGLDTKNDDFYCLFAETIEVAYGATSEVVAKFPLKILRSSIMKQPSAIDICLEPTLKEKLSLLFILATKHHYWDVADGVWSAFLELDYWDWAIRWGVVALYESILSGNFIIAHQLLEKLGLFSYDTAIPHPWGVTPIYLAASMGQNDMIELLSEYCEEDESERSHSADGQLHQEHGHVLDGEEVLQILGHEEREDEPDKGQDIMEDKKIDIAEREHPTGIWDSDDPSPLIIAAASGLTETVNLLLELGYPVDGRGLGDNTALHGATLFGHKEIVKILLDAGAYADAVNSQGRTAMFMAAAGNWVSIIDLLLESGAHPAPRDHDKMTPLHMAAYNSSFRAATILLERAPGSLHIKSKKNITPLYAAVVSGSGSITRLVLDKGGLTESLKKPDGALHWAAISKFDSVDEVVKMLLERGADPDSKGKEGLTPLELARREGNTVVSERLLNHKKETFSSLKRDLMPNYRRESSFRRKIRSE